MEDSTLEREPQGGERTSFDAVDWPDELADLYHQRRIDLVRLAYLLTRRQAIAEDVVQEAFIGTAKAWPRVKHPWSYLRTSVVNACRSWGRHQAVVNAHPPAPPEPVMQEPDELWDALGRLDERRRSAIVLRYYLDLPHAEIGELLGCPAATVRSSIHRGLEALRREVEQ